MLRLCRGQTRSAVLLALRPVQATAVAATSQMQHAVPAAHFSAAAAVQPARSSSSTPYVFQAGVNSSPQPGVDRNVWPKSPSQLVIDALKSGPKTRLQLFYAINRGPLAELPVPEPKKREKKTLLTQFPPPPPSAADVARLKAARIKAEADGSLNVMEPRRYPTGILRNAVHLTSVLQHLQRAKRVWARPFGAIEKRMGEAEFASTRAIIEAAGEQASILTSGMGEAAASATMGAAAPSHGQMKKLHARAAAAAPSAKVTDQWVYVLREWADPAFVKKGPVRMEQYQRKIERREARRAKDVAAAEEAGKPLILGRLPHISRRVRRKTQEKADEALEKKKIRIAVKAYHAQLFPDQKKD